MRTKLVSSVLYSCLVSDILCFPKIQGCNYEAQNAKNAVDSLTKRNGELQSQVNDAISSNKMLTEERDRYQKETDATKASLNKYQGAINDYVSNMDGIQKSVADKMADYADRGANVEYKNGMVYVTMDDDLLFKNGKISKSGETALGTLASVLAEHPNLKVVAVGHTDDRSVKGKDSWSVSTERGNAVVRQLKNMKIDPSRLTGAGQGQYNAVGDNSTPEGRKANNRTEIILSDKPLELLNK